MADTSTDKLSMQDYWNGLSDAEKAHQKALMQRLSLMRDQRETNLKEWDNLTYSQRYEINRQADLGYNSLVGDLDERDKNFSMRTGVTRAKDTSILSHAASFDFEPAINAYDKENRMVVELGDNTADLVKRSREIEHWQDKRYEVYREFIAQGTVFVEEEYVQKLIFQKDAKNDDGTDWKPGQKISAYKQDETPLVSVQEDCEANLILGKYVYLASLTVGDIQKQPIVATYREISYPEFKRVYGNWDRSEYVAWTVAKGARYQDNISQIFNNGTMTPTQGSNYGVWGADYFWNLRNPGKNVGLVKVYEPFSNRYQLFANGVMLLPIDFPLTKISPSGLIPIAKGDAERIPNFAYAKGIPANTYVDEKIYDFTYQAMMKKLLQSSEPTLSNNTGRELPRNWAKPGMAYRGIKASMLEPLLPIEARTITQSDTSYFEIVKEIINDKSVDDSFSGGTQDAGQTATVYLEQQKNTISKLFQIIDGIKALERQLIALRIANIYANWTKHESQVIQKEVVKIVDGIPQITEVKKVNKNNYRSETIDTKIKDANQDGLKIIRFYDQADVLPKMQKHVDEEEALSDLFGKPVRVVYMHAPSLSRIFDWTYRIDIIPHDTRTGDAQMLAYLDAKQRIANLFATDPTGIINKEYTLERISEFQDEDSSKAYNLPDPAAQMQQAQMAAAAGQPPPGQSPMGGTMGAGQPASGPSPAGSAMNALFGAGLTPKP